jgi:hypothetical protein
MELVTLRLGGPNVIFAENNRVRLTFTLPAPATAVQALVQSFRVGNIDDDTHIQGVQVRLVPFFNAGVSTTQGEVEIETTFRDDDGFFITPDVAEIEVDLLVIGV